MGPIRFLSRLLAVLTVLAARPVDLTAASRNELTVRADPAYVSPNGDGVRDQAFFYPVLKASTNVQRWRLDIDRERGGRQMRLSGAGMPALIMWDALDKKGVLAEDGR